VSIAQRLVGVWRLVTFEDRPPGRPVRHPFGRDAIGILIYTSNGLMSGQLMRPGRATFASTTITRGTPAELAEAATGYVAYAGMYSVDDERAIVTHHVTMSLFPNLVGTDQHRGVTLEGDILELRAGGMLLRWQRVAGVVDG